MYQASIGLGIFLCLGFLYGLGGWLANNYSWENPSLLDVKTTQEGFLEVSKILGDPRTTTTSHPTTSTSAILLTKDLYASKWRRNLAFGPQEQGEVVCQQNQKIDLLVTVISAPKNTVERNAIRRSWGKTALKLKNAAIVFVVGLPNGPQGLVEELLDESDQFQDLVVTEHLDTYNNLTLKTLAAFDWMLTYCPDAEFILKTDDDMFIQVKNCFFHQLCFLLAQMEEMDLWLSHATFPLRFMIALLCTPYFHLAFYQSNFDNRKRIYANERSN